MLLSDSFNNSFNIEDIFVDVLKYNYYLSSIFYEFIKSYRNNKIYFPIFLNWIIESFNNSNKASLYLISFSS